MDLEALAAKDKSGSSSKLLKVLQHETKRDDERKGDRPQVFPFPDALVEMVKMLPATEREFGLQEGRTVTNHMPRPYFPCTKPVHELSPLVIKDMSLETPHPGKKVFVRVMTSPERIRADVTTVAEDTEGIAVFLQLYQLPEESDLPASSIIWPGRVALIKEPFLSLNGLDLPCLRVDHVSNIMWLSNDDDRIPAKWRQESPVSLKSSVALRMEGNEAVKKQQWAQAHSLYSQAIQEASADRELQPARLNRSLANLKLGRFEDALSDASDQTEASSEKVLFRAARALYELRRYEESLAKMEEISRLYPNNTAVLPELQRVRDRVHESTTGEFSFDRMYAQAAKPCPIIDCATFSKLVEVRPSPGRGRGLFVTQSVKAGDLLLCEKAFAYRLVNFENRDRQDKTTVMMQLGSKIGYLGGQAQLVADIVQKLQHNPPSPRPVLDLDPGEYQPVNVHQVDGHSVVDTYQVMNIVKVNHLEAARSTLESWRSECRFGYAAETVAPIHGIWAIASYINHSCDVNCYRSFIGDMMIIRATRDLPEGTELVMTYALVEPHASYDEAQRKIERWGFKCECGVCINKKEMSRDVIRQRKSLYQQLEGYMHLNYATAPNAGHIRRIKHAIQQMDATFSGAIDPLEGEARELFTPRLASWIPYLSLGELLNRLGKFEDAMTMMVKGLEALGFQVVAPHVQDQQTSGEASVLEVKLWGLATEGFYLAFLGLFRAYRANNPASAAAAKKYFMIAYAIFFGENDTALEDYPDLR